MFSRSNRLFWCGTDAEKRVISSINIGDHIRNKSNWQIVLLCGSVRLIGLLGGWLSERLGILKYPYFIVTKNIIHYQINSIDSAKFEWLVFGIKYDINHGAHLGRNYIIRWNECHSFLQPRLEGTFSSEKIRKLEECWTLDGDTKCSSDVHLLDVDQLNTN